MGSLRPRTPNLPARVPPRPPARVVDAPRVEPVPRIRIPGPAPEPPSAFPKVAGAAAAGLAGAAAIRALTQKPETPPAAPQPAAAPQPDPQAEAAFTDTFKRQYLAREQKREQMGAGGYDPRQQAHALIQQLNAMRRRAGGEVPEAPQMLAQINQLLAKADQQANARTTPQRQTYAAGRPNDPHAQAAVLIGQLNDMRQKAGGEVPQAAQIMAEVRRLQAMGDQQRNGGSY